MSPSEKQTQIKAIRQLVASDQLKEAIRRLIDLTDSVDPGPMHDEALRLSADHQRLQREIRKSVLSEQDVTLRRNRIIDQTLGMLQDLESTPARAASPIRSTSTISKTIHTSSGDGGKKTPWLPIGLGLLALLLIGFFGYRMASKPDQPDCAEDMKNARVKFGMEDYLKAKEHLLSAQHDCGNTKEIAKMLNEVETLLQTAENETGTTPANPTETENPGTTGTDTRPADPPPANDDDDDNDRPTRPDPVRPVNPGGGVLINPNIRDAVVSPSLSSATLSLAFSSKALLQKVSTRNSNRHITRIDDPFLNGQPDRSLFVSHQMSSPVGVVNEQPLGVWYDPGTKKWTIFNQNTDDRIDDGSWYQVLAYKKNANSKVYVHTASTRNTRGSATMLPSKFSDPNQILIVTAVYDSNTNPVYNKGDVGVAFRDGRWHIVNTNGRAISNKAQFNVLDAGANGFVHTVTRGTSGSNYAVPLNHRLINGKPADQLVLVTPNLTGTRYKNGAGVWYKEDRKWYVFNPARNGIARGTKFNIFVGGKIAN